MKISKPHQMLKACADESRLRILHLLSKGEVCVCDLMEALHVPQPKVSRHLSYLRRHGLVQVRREGNWSFYSLSRPVDKFHQNLLTCLNGSLNAEPLFKRDTHSLASLQKNRIC